MVPVVFREELLTLLLITSYSDFTYSTALQVVLSVAVAIFLLIVVLKEDLALISSTAVLLTIQTMPMLNVFLISPFANTANPNSSVK